MSAKTVIYRDGPFTLEKTHVFDQEALSLFDATVWGSEGARYAHKNTQEHVRRIGRPILVELRKNDVLVGTCLFIERHVKAGNYDIVSNLVRYLIIHPDHRGQGLMKKYSAETMSLVRAAAEQPTIFIGIVEKANKRSFHIVRSVDYQPLSTIKTMTFSRFFPPDCHFVRPVRPSERQVMEEKLRAFYANYALWHTENLLLDDTYFVFESDGEIVAGLQAHRAHWIVQNLPGWSGKVLVRLLPVVPLLRKIFNPKDFNFLAFDYLYVKSGYESTLPKLFSAVLHRYNLNTALFWMDERSSLFDAINPLNLGIFQRFASGNDSYFMVGFENTESKMEDIIRRMPAFISSGDFI